jgi:hypothetical protein
LVIPDWPLMSIHSVHIPSSWIRLCSTVCGRRMIGLDECPVSRVQFGDLSCSSAELAGESCPFFRTSCRIAGRTV